MKVERAGVERYETAADGEHQQKTARKAPSDRGILNWRGPSTTGASTNAKQDGGQHHDEDQLGKYIRQRTVAVARITSDAS